MITMERPAPPAWEQADRYEWRALPDLDWSTDELQTNGRGCRYMVAGRRSCGRPAVAVLFRPVYAIHGPRRAWAYCERHLYGRWIEDGIVMTWASVEKGAPDGLTIGGLG